MRCPKCDTENNDSAKFCKKCGTPLNKGINHENMINSMNKNSGSDNTTKFVIIALIVVAIILAGTFVYIYGFGQQNQSDGTQVSQAESDQSVDQDDEPEQAQTTQASQSSPKTTSMSIRGGSFKTGGELEDLTYASIYVGPEHAGKDIIIQIFYSRDGNTLNNGNMVPQTVDSSGYINVKSADAYKYFPDYAEINLFDSSGKTLLDSKSVSLSPESGTQTF